MMELPTTQPGGSKGGADVTIMFDRKPERRFYLHACEKHGLKPSEVIFLDDLGVNLKTGKELGMETIRTYLLPVHRPFLSYFMWFFGADRVSFICRCSHRQVRSGAPKTAGTARHSAARLISFIEAVRGQALSKCDV